MISHKNTTFHGELDEEFETEQFGPFCCLTSSVMFFPSFAEFIQGVSQFSVKGDKESKMRCECLSVKHDILPNLIFAFQDFFRSEIVI